MNAIADALGLGPDDGIFFAAGKEAQAAKLAGARAHPRRRAARPDRREARSNSAGSSISRCSNMTRTRRRSTSATTPSRCRRASWRRWRPRTRSTSSPTSTTSSATAWSCRRARSGTTARTSCTRRSRSPATRQAEVDTNFAGMINAFKFGAPPHGGSAPGIDRIVMLLADEPNIREVIALPDEPEGRGSDDERAGAGHARSSCANSTSAWSTSPAPSPRASLRQRRSRPRRADNRLTWVSGGIRVILIRQVSMSLPMKHDQPCAGCRDGAELDIAFSMAFQPIVDVETGQPLRL